MNLSEKQKIIRLARQAVEERLGLASQTKEEILIDIGFTPQGLFVTLYRDGELRGCIGTMELRTTLTKSIKEMAQASAFDDSRFSPLEKTEYSRLEFEISLLSPLQKVGSADEIVPGKHGVWIRKDFRSGVFLPQVWEDLPDKTLFLNTLCVSKAGLPPNAWKEAGVDILVFTVDIISEKRESE